MTKIKICGLSRPEDITAVNKALPDYIGFVFARSRRQVTKQTAKALKAMLRPEIKAVGVFVNEDPNQIIHICNLRTIDAVQLHGDEGEEYIQILKRSIQNPIIKAVRVQTAEDILRAEKLSCDFLLLDTYLENQYGGSGETFDWSVIGKVKKPYFLAGGIRPGNAEAAVRKCRPYCIDVSSGVETDGFKDANKIMDIVMKVRSVR